MSRDEEREAGHRAAIDHIVEIGRQTRSSPPRWLWIVAIVVGALGAGGFAAALLAEPAPVTASPAVRSADGSGMGGGLVIGAAVGIVIGYAIARQRADHSSRSKP